MGASRAPTARLLMEGVAARHKRRCAHTTQCDCRRPRVSTVSERQRDCGMRDIVLAGTAVALLASTMTLGRQPECRTEIAARALAPDGKLQAIAFRHGCGTATPTTELVSIFPMGGST